VETRQRPILRPLSASLIAGLIWAAATAVAAQGEAPPRRSSEQVIAALREKRGKDLTHFLRGLPRLLEKVDLSDRHLESLLAELQRIQETDPYQEKVSGWIEVKGVGIGGEKVFVNREAASLLRLTLPEWVDRHRLRLWLNSLRELPLEERTTKILSRIESLQKPLDVTHPLVRGLNELGPAGVPFMLRYPSQDNNVRLSIVEALSQIEDPRGADYIIGLLQTKGEYAFPYRATAVRALANFEGEKVIRALIDVLKEDPFPVRQEAARALTAVTGKHFGLLFNGDAKTWIAWLETPDKRIFKPTGIQRSLREKELVIEQLFDRYLEARIQIQGNGEDLLLTQKEGMKRVSQDLRSLGKPVVSLMVYQCRIRMEQNPRQEKELKVWTQKLLRSLRWPEAKQATASL